MDRGQVKNILMVLLVVGLIFIAGRGDAQQFFTSGESPTPSPTDLGVEVREITPTLETMGLIWIQEGDVRRLAYVVQTGDTLWDIAGRYLNSNYYWPKVWERNSFIINPHLIFPGDILYIYPEGLIERPAFDDDAIPVVPIDDDLKAKHVIYQKQASIGFVTIEELEKAGSIIDDPDHRTLLGENDPVYVDVGKVNRIETGDSYSIFRIKKSLITGKNIEVFHPVTGEHIGYILMNLGEIIITKVEAKVSEAYITNAFEEIEHGDLITPSIMPLAPKVEVKGTTIESLLGYVIATRHEKGLLGQNDIVYIDKGSDDGVVRGNMFSIYEPCEIVEDKVTGNKVRIPENINGLIVILKAMKTTSVGLITRANKEIVIGDNVSMSRYKNWEIEGVSQPHDVDKCRTDPRCRLITNEEYENGMDNPLCVGPVLETNTTNKKRTTWNYKKKEKTVEDNSE
jgi:LysM domain